METLWTRIKSEVPNIEDMKLYYDALGDAILLRQQGYDFKLVYIASKYEPHATWDVSYMSWMSETTPESLIVSRGAPRNSTKDKAILADNKDVGGIDMNNIEMKKQGQGSSIQFDSVDMDAIIKENIQGFVPVIINVTPVNTILPILGLEPSKNKEEYEVSQL